VSWVISEHKSQGLFQTTVGQNRFENFWVFSSGGSSANNTASALFEKVFAKQEAVEGLGGAANTK
jgi:hypothetical protein